MGLQFVGVKWCCSFHGTDRQTLTETDFVTTNDAG
jgi:hypothetical protein